MGKQEYRLFTDCWMLDIERNDYLAASSVKASLYHESIIK